MTPKEEELMGKSEGNPSPSLVTTITTPSLRPEGLSPSVSDTTTMDSVVSDQVLLDNSSNLVPGTNPSLEASADNVRAPMKTKTDTHYLEHHRADALSASPSKRDNSSSSLENDSSELPSQRSVDSAGSCSLDGTHLKNGAVGAVSLLSAGGAERLDPPKIDSLAAVSSETERASLDANQETLSPVVVKKDDGVDKKSFVNADLTEDVFPIGDAPSSVFCTCASGHPFVVDRCSISEMSTSLSSRSDDTEVTAALMGSQSATTTDAQQQLFDHGSYALELEPNLHLPNERCNRSRTAVECDESGKDSTPPCPNYAYDCDEDYFKNDFVQDLYPILSPQQLPYQVQTFRPREMGVVSFDFSNLSY